MEEDIIPVTKNTITDMATTVMVMTEIAASFIAQFTEDQHTKFSYATKCFDNATKEFDEIVKLFKNNQ